MLLLQSAKWPLIGGGKWEVTGGAPDRWPRETVLRAAEREAWEEAGVKIERIDALVGRYHFHVPWMLWTGHNMKIMFVASVADGDDGVKNIKLNWFEHRAFCWAKEAQLSAMAVDAAEAPQLKMEGMEAKPTNEQFTKMQYISGDGKDVAISAFKVLHDCKAKKSNGGFSENPRVY
jgi:8-oxo-dGTP pyrophosphatase MutT (NUDIX family)